MALYQLHDATLAGIDGKGYAYAVDTFEGRGFKGIFFADAEHEDQIEEALESDEPSEFTGMVYLSTRERTDTLTVKLTQTVHVGAGARTDFESVDD